MIKTIRRVIDGIRELIVGSVILLSGKVVANLLGIYSLAITAKTLGAGNFGQFVLITTFCLVVDKICNFQNWQYVIKYGSECYAKKDSSRFNGVIGKSLQYDALFAIVATCVAIAGSGLFLGSQGLGRETWPLLILCSSGILLNMTGTATGILRLDRKFVILSMHATGAALVKALGATVCLIYGLGLSGFIISGLISTVFGSFFINYFAFSRNEFLSRTLIYQKTFRLGGGTRTELKFMWFSNLSTSLRAAIKELDVLFVGALVSADSAGVYKVAKSSSQILSKVVDPLFTVIYPILTKLVSTKQFLALRNQIRRASLATGSLGLFIWGGLVICGEFILALVFGDEFGAAYYPMLIYSFAMMFWLFLYPISAYILAVGRADFSLKLTSISIVIYIPILIFLIGKIGEIGAALAHLVFTVIWSVSLLVFYFTDIKTRNDEDSKLDDGY